MNSVPRRATSLAELAGFFREAFEANGAARRHALAALVEKRTRQGVVLAMMANSGYMDLFENWAWSCDRNGIEVRSWSVLFTVDAQAAARAERLGFRTYTDPISYGEQPAAAVERFGDGNFRRLMFQKTAIVRDVLDLGCDVLFQDVDVVWRKDPLEYLLERCRRGVDAQFMYDGPTQRHAPLNANTGFFLLRNTPAVRAFWAEVLSEYPTMVRGGGQQQIINAMLARANLAVEILPEEHFANGHLFNLTRPSRMPRDPFVVHCSWTGDMGHKLEKYRRENLWYAPSPPRGGPTAPKPAQSAATASVNAMRIVEEGGRDFFLFLDIFAHWSGRKLTAVAPYYGDDIDWSVHGVDYENVVLKFDSHRVRGKYVPHRLDSWEPAILLDFEHPALEEALRRSSSISFTVTTGPHERRFVLPTAPPRPFGVAISVIIRDENRWIRTYLDYYLSCLGAEHVFVYDNGTVDREELLAILRPYMDDGTVTYTSWDYRWRNKKDRKQIGQPPQQAHTLNRYGNTRWIGFFDVDEFLRIPGRSLPEFLSAYDPIRIDGLSFGTRWFLYQGPLAFEEVGNPLLTFLHAKRDRLGRKRQKLVVSPRDVRFLRFHWLEENKRELPIDDTEVFFHHYALRKQRFDEGKRDAEAIYDPYMLRFADRLAAGREDTAAAPGRAAPKPRTSEEWIAHLRRSWERAEKCESELSNEVLSIQGMAGLYNRHFYNNLCAFEGCRYLEIGSYTGASFCAAIAGHSLSAVAIDNWSRFGGPRATFFANLEKHRGAAQVQVVEQDCFTVDTAKLGKFSVFLYDGGHRAESYVRAFERYYECLEDRAIVIIDDWNWEEVRRGTQKAIRELNLPVVFTKEIVLPDEDVIDMPRHPGRLTWWNGICAMVIDKTARREAVRTAPLRSGAQVAEIVEAEASTAPLSAIIFSKDRACQLDALLRSMDRCLALPHDRYVLCTASTPEFEAGYELVKRLHGDLTWIREQSFRDDLLRLIRALGERADRNVMFLVDDIVFTREFTGEGMIDALRSNPDILAVSLRLGEDIRYCHPRRAPTEPPEFLDGHVWEWRRARRGYWNYPMSQDGNIFRVSDLVEYLATFRFHNPNSLEAATAGRPLGRPYLLCDRKPYLVNLALNRVQKTFANPCADISAESLNQAFLAGFSIDVQPFAGQSYTSCHIEPEIRLYHRVDGGARERGAAGARRSNATGRRVDLRDLTFYVINLKEDVARRRFMESQLRNRGLKLELVEGVPCEPRFLGTGVSHLKILRREDLPVPFVILEDDCQFTDPFRPCFEVPEETDAFYLGVSRLGLETPGEPGDGLRNNVQFAQFDENCLRVFNMLGCHAVVYLTERYRQAAIEAAVAALTHPIRPYPIDVAFATSQPSHLILTPNDPLCFQSRRFGRDTRATSGSLRVPGRPEARRRA